jgi:DNA-binding response OmpR family regulator
MPWEVTQMPAPQNLNIIIVEDNNELREILATGLALFGHSIRSVPDGKSLDSALAHSPADIIILDLGLPDEDGVIISQRLRRQHSECGIIMLTARGKVDDRILGLSSGADLYFVKPVDIRELDAAIRSLARRLSTETQTGWGVDQLASILITPGGVKIPLSAQEFIFINMLMAKPGENISRRIIFTALNQPDDLYADKRLETMISRLRSKVRSADPGAELPVRARHNLGYAFLAAAYQTDTRQ